MGLSADERGRLALIPGEVSARLDLLEHPVVVDGDAKKIEEHLRNQHRATMILSAATCQSARWPAVMKEDPAYKTAVSLRNDFRNHLLAHEELLAGRRSAGGPFSELEDVFNAKKDALSNLCRAEFPRLSAAQWLGLLAFCKRIEEAGETLLKAARASSQMDWHALNQDCSL